DFVVRVAPGETDPVTLAALLARASAAFRHYLSDAQRDAAAPALEAALLDNMRGADSPGRRISFLRTFMDCAWSRAAHATPKDLLPKRLEVAGAPLSSRA